VVRGGGRPHCLLTVADRRRKRVPPAATLDLDRDGVLDEVEVLREAYVHIGHSMCISERAPEDRRPGVSVG
jgi:hypothetical protein